MKQEYLILTASSAFDLTKKVNEHIQIRYKPEGSHQVHIKHSQNRFAGTQHRDTVNELEYSQTMIRTT